MYKKVLNWAIVALVITAGIFALVRYAKTPGPLDEFATCLGTRGAEFYGTFWCPHCQNQKAMFGKSQKKLPYIECSTPDGQGQTNICKEKEIQGYPTWIFADGSRMSGEIPLAKLAEKTGCMLPQN